MKWKIRSIESDKVTEITYLSRLNFTELVESSKMALDQARTSGNLRFLVDCIDLKLSATRSEIFDLPNSQYKKWDVDPSAKSALINSKDIKYKLILEFYILATKNMGYNVKLFDDRKKALEWLSND